MVLFNFLSQDHETRRPKSGCPDVTLDNLTCCLGGFDHRKPWGSSERLTHEQDVQVCSSTRTNCCWCCDVVNKLASRCITASADARSHLSDPTAETDSKDAIPNRAVMMQMNIVSTDDHALQQLQERAVKPSSGTRLQLLILTQRSSRSKMAPPLLQ